MSCSKRLVSFIMAIAMLIQPVVASAVEDAADSVNSTDETYNTSDISNDAEEQNEKEDSSSIELNVSDAYDELSIYDETYPEGSELSYAENDPSYIKYAQSLNNVGAAWGSKNLTHQSRFASSPKTFGIDVSRYQTTIDWNKVKSDGIEFVIIRVGWSGYGNGAGYIDDNFHTNIRGAQAAGLKVGVYYYTQAITTAEAKKEAQLALSFLSGYTLDLPVYYDYEDPGVGRLYEANLSKAEGTAMAKAFCQTIQAGGYTAGVYASKSWLEYKLDSAELAKKYPIWLAHFNNSTSYAGDFGIWQYSSSGTVSGISGYVDMNVAYDFYSLPQVTNLKASNMSATTCTLKWSAVSGATGYKIYEQGVGSGLVTLNSTVKTTSAKVKLPNANAKFYVVAYSESGGKILIGKPSSSIILKTNKVINLALSNSSATSLTIKWDRVANASGYEVQKYNSSTGAYATMKRVSSNSCTATGLSPKTTYKFKVRPYFNSNGSSTYVSGTSKNGSLSEAFSAKTSAANVVVKEAPSNFNVKGYTKNAIRVGWKSLSGVSSYNVYLYKNNVYTKVAKTNAAEYKFTGLSANTTYKMKVEAVYSDGATATSAATAINTKPSIPTGLKQTASTDTSVSLSWNSVSGTSFYRIYIYDTSNAKHVKKVDVADATSCKISGLEKGSRYRFKIRSIRLTSIRNYLSDFSSSVAVKTSGAKYYKVPSYSGYSIADALNSIGIDTSMLPKIAKTNAIGNYSGTAAQNLKILTLLLTGKLMIPQ